MGKIRTKVTETRKPKHGLDANRPSTSKKGARDAATVLARAESLRWLILATALAQSFGDSTHGGSTISQGLISCARSLCFYHTPLQRPSTLIAFCNGRCCQSLHMHPALPRHSFYLFYGLPQRRYCCQLHLYGLYYIRACLANSDQNWHCGVQVRRLKMYSKTAKRDKKGKIVHQVGLYLSEASTYPQHLVSGPVILCRPGLESALLALLMVCKHLASYLLSMSKQDLQSKELPSTRIQPDRRWFGNTRVVGQQQLEKFRDEMSAKVGTPFLSLVAYPL